MSHFKNEVTEDTKKKIHADKNKVNNFAKIDAGETKEWQFDSMNYDTEVQDNFGNDRVRFRIYDPAEDSEFDWNASMTAARQVLDLFDKGKFFLKISRTGSGMQDTRYKVEPIES